MQRAGLTQKVTLTVCIYIHGNGMQAGGEGKTYSTIL